MSQTVTVKAALCTCVSASPISAASKRSIAMVLSEELARRLVPSGVQARSETVCLHHTSEGCSTCLSTSVTLHARQLSCTDQQQKPWCW